MSRPGRSTVKAGRHDGQPPREAYQAKFKMAVLANEWGPIEKARQLAAALEGEAPQVLLDLSADEMASCEDLATALECWFGRMEPAVGLRQRLAARYRKPGEKLSVLAG
ncbi:hypothetical protein EOD39_18544 [Acipenser ruthenus]|uniref:Paraneoplastic antigen Ma-like C-terminal domain-containing protein n=1 Tax=Acipenser ruthenus TaxID=7906 RepID=A0A444V0Q7_ACIRT|nr:hypothetical protein EOD39_18544 [Acipenser ruthenus]